VADLPSQLNLGFLTVLRESGGYVGGYLVTNAWGRPLEFRLSTAVQPNRVQQILYAGTLETFICADLIGKTLVERTAVPTHILLTDTESVLDLRHRLEMPAAWIANQELGESMTRRSSTLEVRGPLYCHARFPTDVKRIETISDQLAVLLDLAEPFTRIREAIGEARKMGLARAA